MKKSPFLLFSLTVLALCIFGVGGWIVFGPALPTPQHEMPSPVRVKVDQPDIMLPAPTSAVTPGPVGDEKAEPEAATTTAPAVVPPPSAPDQATQPPEQLAAQPVETPPQQVATIAPPPPAAITSPRSEAPKIAVVIDDLGLDIGGTKRAIGLPAFVTLSFMPYATRLKEQTTQGRESGHELLLHMPMEPIGHEDPGPGALLVALPPEEIRKRFETALASFTGFDGVNNHMGSKFTADQAGMEIVIDELQQRNLFFLDSRTSGKTVGESIARQHGLPTIGRDIFLDDDMAISAVREQMEQAERVARRKGIAVVIGHPHPATLEALESWLPDAQSRGFVFVPIRELVKPQ